METSAVARALLGDLVDVEKMGPDPSGVHVPGLIAVPTRRKKAVQKAVPLAKLRIGRLKSLKSTLGDPAAFKQMAGATKLSNAAMGASGKTNVVNAAMPAAVPKKTVGGAIAGGAGARDALNSLLGTNTGRVAAGGTVGTAYLAGKHRGQDQGVYKREDGVSTKRRVAEGVGLGATAIGTGYGVKELADHLPEAYPKTGPAAAKVKRVGRGLMPEGVHALSRNPKARVLTAGALLAGDATATAVLGSGHKKPEQVTKAAVDDVTFGGAFSKFDNDKRQAFGWASVVELNGEPVVDRQGDYIGIDDIEEAAYAYIRKSRVAGDMHRRTDADEPFKAGEVIESVVFTKDKCQAMGLPMACAGKWWIGVQVDDEPTWEAVKKQARTGFSIHGKGLRKDTSLDEIRAS